MMHHWQRVLSTVLYMAVTLPSPWIGLAIIHMAADYVDERHYRSAQFSEGSMWNGCPGFGLAIYLMILLSAVVVADIAFAIYTHVRARTYDYGQ